MSFSVSRAQAVTAQSVTARNAIMGGVRLSLRGRTKYKARGSARLMPHLASSPGVRSEVLIIMRISCESGDHGFAPLLGRGEPGSTSTLIFSNA